MSGDGIYDVKDSSENYGSLGIFIAESAGGKKTHFATTCYHVCYRGKRLSRNLKRRHQKLIEDSNNTQSSTHKARYRYSSARNENRTCQLGTFLWGLYNEQHDISLIKLRKNVNCSCTMSDITCSELPSKKDIVGIYKRCKGAVKVENTGFSTRRREGILRGFNFCEAKKGGPDIRKGYIIENKDDSSPFSASGDSGALVKIIPVPSENEDENTEDETNEEKIPFAYIVIGATEGKTVCHNLRNSLDEYIHFNRGRIKACLGSCAAATSS